MASVAVSTWANLLIASADRIQPPGAHRVPEPHKPGRDHVGRGPDRAVAADHQAGKEQPVAARHHAKSLTAGRAGRSGTVHHAGKETEIAAAVLDPDHRLGVSRQPAAIDALCRGLDRGDGHQVLLGITGGSQFFTDAAMILMGRFRGGSMKIAVLASGILCMEHHTPENIQQDIDYLVGLQADFVQFMLLTPVPMSREKLSDAVVSSVP